MEAFILTAGQLMLALCAVASCMALVCIIVWMVRWLFRVFKSLQRLDRPQGGERSIVGGGVRKW